MRADSINSRILTGYIAILVATLIAALFLHHSNQTVTQEVNGFVDDSLPAFQAVNTT